MSKNKKKNQKRNPFFYYLKDLQEQFKAEGRNLSLSQISEMAGDRWKNLSQEQKKFYEDLVIQEKASKHLLPGLKFASDGTKIEDNLKKEREEELEKEKMKLTVKNLVKELGSVEAIVSEKFYIGCFNITCATDKEYLPNEVGLVEYSLQCGISRCFHKFIHPGSIPPGFTYSAKAHSEDTHNIPLPCAENAVSNYRELYYEILQFINPESQINSTSFINLFCLSKDIIQNRGCLEWLHYKSGIKGDIKITVQDLAYLLMEVRATVDKPYPSYSLASDDLQKNTFDYTPDTRCSMHEELDNAYCALGYAKRLCFLFSDSACAYFDVEVTEKHLPKRIDINTNFDVLQQQSSLDYTVPTDKKRIYYAQNSKSDLNDSFKDFSIGDTVDVSTEPPSKYNSLTTAAPSCSRSHQIQSSSDTRQPRSASVAQALTLLKLQKTTSVLTQGTGIGRGKLPVTPRKPGSALNSS